MKKRTIFFLFVFGIFFILVLSVGGGCGDGEGVGMMGNVITGQEGIVQKRITALIFTVAMLVAISMTMFGGSTAQAHESGHSDGCKGFGELVSDVLAGPDFGQDHRENTPNDPKSNADMVDEFGHALCD